MPPLNRHILRRVSKRIAVAFEKTEHEGFDLLAGDDGAPLVRMDAGSDAAAFWLVKRMTEADLKVDGQTDPNAVMCFGAHTPACGIGLMWDFRKGFDDTLVVKAINQAVLDFREAIAGQQTAT